MTQREVINYVELPAKNIPATKAFFEQAFSWKFVDYGEEYTGFSNSGIEGGFYLSELVSSTATGACLLVLLSDDLEDTERRVKKSGGIISQGIFSFPGGRRFHFTEPSGNELAVWSPVKAYIA
ncbi:VOC family protein [Colwellia psychrerythraea]|uniref:Glyoxalase-like domain containing protein n=1 Tax=Colwellia psychrerythraea TaxID=28229 RepID=A0A099KCV6_COLPS|nr:VOC family protein [Colwellia psychrerythraea]KGJ87423.1 Glyoxalase-like domain containing protein [Colwellia psychrerythraea]